MKKEDEDMKSRDWLFLLIPFLFITFSILFILFYIMPNVDGSNNYKCDRYTNISNGATYLFGKCYVQACEYYETNKVCGTFGISCYESKESHYEAYCYQKCINVKSGGEC